MADRISLFREDGSGGGLMLFVGGDEPAPLEHQEHTTIPVPPGHYRVVRQKEYEPMSVERMRQVAD